MVLESPIWLLGLLPWVAVVFYLLPGKGRAHSVPFLEFWKDTAISPRRTARRMPPISIVLVLIALLLALLAAAQPTRRVKSMVGGDISIILDRGVSMALRSTSGEPFRGVIRKCAAMVGPLGNNVRVTLIPVPGTAIETTGDGWVAAAEAMSPSVVPVQIEPVIADRLRQTHGSIFVLTDHRIDVVDPRVGQVMPDEPEPFVAITAIGAKSLPRSEVMVRLENHSEAKSILLKVRSGSGDVERTISLPSRGQSTDQFVDTENLSDVVTAEIASDSERNPWARASLVKQSSGINIVVDRSLPAAVQRIAAIYSKDRPAGSNAKPIVVSSQRIDQGQSGICINMDSLSESNAEEPVSVAPHPLTRNVTARPIAVGRLSPPAGFVAVISRGRNAMIAVSEDPVRQIWVNADFRKWDKTTDFVVFFGNAFDWLSAGDQQYVSTDVLPPGVMWPGVYQDNAGKQVAVNAGVVPTMNSPREVVDVVRSRPTLQRESLQSWVILGALACLATAVLIAPR